MNETARTEVDSFGTFLETLRREAQAHSSIGDIASKLLTVLAESGPQDARQLLGRTGIALTDFAEALNTLVDSGLVRTHRADELEMVELTERGHALV